MVLYGAGGAGRLVARHLQAQGIKLEAFLDAKASSGAFKDGIPVFTLGQWLGSNQVESMDVLVSVHSHAINVAPILDMLRAAGFSRVLTMVDYANLFPEDDTNRYWLTSANYYTGKQDKIDAARALLGDEASQQWFDATLRLRLTGDYHGLPEARYIEQYMPRDLPGWSNPMRLIDCGAYDGDTIDALLRAGYEIAAAVAFEPDLKNYNKLATRFSGLNALFLPCGVSSAAGLVQFDDGLGAASRIGGVGDTIIQCVSIDTALPRFTPTLIKMDIEGAELAALRGAEQTLCRYRPELAIAVYHEPGHLWEIALWLAKLDLGYRMYLRGHGQSGYDLVLYCRTD